jgi:Ca-activated chloride channel family protein
MSERLDDPRLTAYALDELDVEQASSIEALLASDAGARAELAEIQRVSALIERALSAEGGLGLSASHKASLDLALQGALASKRRSRTARVASALAGAAALAWIALFFVGPRYDGQGVTRESARYVRLADETEFLDGPDLPLVPGVPGVLGAPGAHPENPFIEVATDPRSTFSIDVDTASYALVRRALNEGTLPFKGAVRIEELVNYFTYAYPEPKADEPFAITAEVAAAPWAPEHRLLRLGLKARHIPLPQRPPSNLVFLVDVSGSMADPDKLPLLKEGLRMLVRELDARDRVAIVVYAGSSGLALAPTPGDRKQEILSALDRLEAGGSTDGGAGIQLAYSLATESFVEGGVNRVLLATDGDFNVGVTEPTQLAALIQEKAKTGVFLSVLGFGHGNYKDASLEQLADKGNGNYAYIDGAREAHKVLVQQMQGTLITVAKDVKLQLELNPTEVRAFRLLGYENRVLAHTDFNDDEKDAGEIGADHTVTAFYELIPAAGAMPESALSPLKYQQQAAKPVGGAHGGELLTVQLRSKLPDGERSSLQELVVRDSRLHLDAASPDFRFGAAVAGFGMLLRDSPHRGSASYAQVLALAEPTLATARDREARSEFIALVRKAAELAAAKDTP